MSFQKLIDLENKIPPLTIAICSSFCEPPHGLKYWEFYNTNGKGFLKLYTSMAGRTAAKKWVLNYVTEEELEICFNLPKIPELKKATCDQIAHKGMEGAYWDLYVNNCGKNIIKFSNSMCGESRVLLHKWVNNFI